MTHKSKKKEQEGMLTCHIQWDSPWMDTWHKNTEANEHMHCDGQGSKAFLTCPDPRYCLWLLISGGHHITSQNVSTLYDYALFAQISPAGGEILAIQGGPVTTGTTFIVATKL